MDITCAHLHVIIVNIVNILNSSANCTVCNKYIVFFFLKQNVHLNSGCVIELDQKPSSGSDSSVQVVETSQEYRDRVVLADGARRAAAVVFTDVRMVARFHRERGQRVAAGGRSAKSERMTSA